MMHLSFRNYIERHPELSATQVLQKWLNDLAQQTGKVKFMDNFPRGKMNTSDDGQLEIAIGIKDTTVIIAFRKELSWLGMDKQAAINFANGILEKANSI